MIRAAHEKASRFRYSRILRSLHKRRACPRGVSPLRDRVAIATKFGFDNQKGGLFSTAGRSTSGKWLKNPEAPPNRPHRTVFPARVDPNVPIEDVAGAVKELIVEGKVLHFGLSQASAKTIRRAHAIQPVSAVRRNTRS